MQIIGYLCAIEALILSGIALYPLRMYRRVPDGESDELFLDEGREMSPMSPLSSTDVPNNNHHHINHHNTHHHHTNNKLSPGSPLSDDGGGSGASGGPPITSNNHHPHHHEYTKLPPSPDAMVLHQKPYIPGMQKRKKNHFHKTKSDILFCQVP